MLLEITGKRFDELTLIILSRKRVTVNKHTPEKSTACSLRWQKLSFLSRKISNKSLVPTMSHIDICTCTEHLSLFNVSIWVVLVYNPVQKHFISSRNQIGFICACEMVCFAVGLIQKICSRFSPSTLNSSLIQI